MFNHKWIFFTLLGTLFFINSVYAEYKVAIVDLNRVVNSTQEAKQKQKELEKLSDIAKADYKKRVDKVKQLEQSYVKSNNEEQAIELEKATRDLRIFESDTKESLRKKFQETNRKLLKEVTDVISDYAKDNDIDLVLDKNSLVLGAVVYNQDAIDITDELVKKVR